MCKLCSTDPTELKNAREDAFRTADKLERAAVIYRGLGHGSIKPHTEDFKQNVLLFKSIIRKLVREYV